MNHEEDIFEAAAALPAAERAAYLDAACAGQPEIRAQDRGPARARTKREDSWRERGGGRQPGTPGGMGRSPAGGSGRADRPLQTARANRRRRVRRGLHGRAESSRCAGAWRSRSSSRAWTRREVIARFEAERQALAMMDHPNIAKVFDAGATDHGRPYFVMELVRGRPDHRLLRRSEPADRRNGSSCSSRSARRSSTRTRRASSTATSSRRTSWSRRRRRRAGAEGHRLRHGQGDRSSR